MHFDRDSDGLALQEQAEHRSGHVSSEGLEVSALERRLKSPRLGSSFSMIVLMNGGQKAGITPASFTETCLDRGVWMPGLEADLVKSSAGGVTSDPMAGVLRIGRPAGHRDTGAGEMAV